MERNNSVDHHHHDDQSSPHSWWSNSHSRAPHSQWLQSTLSELDSKIKMILNVIEDDGDTFAQRAEMYYQKRPQLIEMVKDLQRSYSALADRYDQLKSESSIKAISYNNSLSNSSNSLVKRATPIKAKRLMNPQNATNYENVESPSCVIGFEDRSVADFSDGSTSIEFFSGDQYRKPTGDDLVVESKYRSVDEDKNSRGVMMSEGFWDEQMKFSKLLEENLSQQAELIKRNEENMELINKLRKENKALLSQTQRPCSNGDDGNNGSSSCHHHRNKIIGGGPFKGKEEPHRRKFRGFLCMP